nr:anaphase-promoting complex subunit Hcn1 [Polyrhizophydium stewartii]
MQECQSLILKVPFFKDADHFFITQVVMILHVTHYMPGDYVIEEGNIGDNMFFIASDTLEVIVGGIVRTKITSGDFFGEIALMFGRMRRTASVRAVTNCILYSLSRPDLNTILEHHPKMADKMRKIAEERLAVNAGYSRQKSEDPNAVAQAVPIIILSPDIDGPPAPPVTPAESQLALNIVRPGDNPASAPRQPAALLTVPSPTPALTNPSAAPPQK